MNDPLSQVRREKDNGDIPTQASVSRPSRVFSTSC